MMHGDELSHLIKLQASGQAKEARPFLYGHVSIYDSKTHRVQCIIPSLAGQGGIPVLTPWMPLGTVWAGNGFGFQVAPKGGASFANPTAGEQVIIGVFDREFGTLGALLMTWNLATPTPDQTLQPGEAVMQHETGSNLKFNEDGSISLISISDLNATVGGNLSATVTGTATIDAPEIVLAGGGPAVARVGDSVTVGSQMGTIVSGSSKVTSG